MKHPHCDVVLPRHLEAVRFSQPAKMRDFFIQEIGRIRESQGNKWNMRILWNEYIVDTLATRWSVGLLINLHLKVRLAAIFISLCNPAQFHQFTELEGGTGTHA